MGTYKIEEIEGIGPKYASDLAKAEITQTSDLLNLCASPKGRKDVAAQTGCSESQILKWTNKADLMRINGVGEEYSDLLEESGVDTVKELKHRVAANLVVKMTEVNDKRNLTRLVPTEKTVQKWIDQAKDMEALLTY